MSLPDSFLPFIAILFIFLTLIVVAMGVVIFYNLFNRWLRFIQKEESREVDEIINDAYKQAFTIIENARKEAISTIQEANSKAQSSLLETKRFTDTEINEWNSTIESSLHTFQNSLDKTTQEMLDYYHQVINEHKSRNLVTLKKLTKHLEHELLDETQQYEEFLKDEAVSFGNTMKERTVTKEDELTQKLDDTYRQVAGEIDSYKQRRLKEINLSIMDILQTATEDMLGRSLSTQDHEELIYQSLNEAIQSNQLPKSHGE